MPLLYLADGRARPVDAAELPSLVADAHDDADALGALTEIALSLDEDAARAAAGAALARLRALRREGRAGGVDVDALAAQLGAALHAARARDDVDARDVAGAPVRAPVWRGALAVTEPLVPRAALPGVVLFALSDETLREAGHAAPTRTAALARALPLAVGERVLPHADALVVAPVVAGRGAYVATKAWALPEMLALSPTSSSDAAGFGSDASVLVGGRLLALEGAQLTVALDVWDLRAGVLARTLALTGGAEDVVARAADAVIEVVTGKATKRAKGGVLPRRVARALAPGLVDAPVTPAQLEAMADAHVALLAAAGAFPAAALANADVALERMRALVAGDASLRARLTLVSFVVACTASSLLDAGARDLAARTAEELARDLASSEATSGGRALASVSDALATALRPWRTAARSG